MILMFVRSVFVIDDFIYYIKKSSTFVYQIKINVMKTLVIIGLFTFIILNVVRTINGVSKFGEDWYNL